MTDEEITELERLRRLVWRARPYVPDVGDWHDEALKVGTPDEEWRKERLKQSVSHVSGAQPT